MAVERYQCNALCWFWNHGPLRVPGDKAGLLVSPWLSAFTVAFIQVNERLTSLVTQVGEQVLIEIIKKKGSNCPESLGE